MDNKLYCSLLCLFLFIAEVRLVISEPINKEEYGSPIRVSSAVFTIQENERKSSAEKKQDGKYKTNGEWIINSEIQASSDEYLKFAGVVGSGHIYIPVTSDKQFGKVKDGVLDISDW